ncbi:hypothetical protein [Aliikangiella maris]|uniref:Uncharacterized protein n=2 Tax=Aliikangiella maris TaxID=3162458 RepID=A0ABV3MQS1_9GAMM
MRLLNPLFLIILLTCPLLSFSETNDDLIRPSVEKKTLFYRDSRHDFYDTTFEAMSAHVCDVHIRENYDVNASSSFVGCDKPHIRHVTEGSTWYSMRYQHTNSGIIFDSLQGKGKKTKSNLHQSN